jgi:predicted site-specific integrase-resolvase
MLVSSLHGPCARNSRHIVPMQQIQVHQDHDLVDEEVGMLTDAVVKLKGMVKQIGEETEETGAQLSAPFALSQVSVT